MSKPLTDAQLRETMDAHKPDRHHRSAWMIDARAYRAARDALWQREVLRKTLERLSGLVGKVHGFEGGVIHNAIEDIEVVLGGSA